MQDSGFFAHLSATYRKCNAIVQLIAEVVMVAA